MDDIVFTTPGSSTDARRRRLEELPPLPAVDHFVIRGAGGQGGYYTNVTFENLPRLWALASASLADANALLERSAAQMTRLRTQVRAASLEDALERLEHPPAQPKPESRVRVR